jgi:membrane peptidoglycan carboxypeptidase
MSERPDFTKNSSSTGWHEPKTKFNPTPKPPQQVVTVTALPANLSNTPTTSGGWHLPSKTPYTTNSTVDMKVKATTSEPVIRPEDLIADILGQGKRPLASVAQASTGSAVIRPEDMLDSVKTTSTPSASEISRPEDFALPKTGPLSDPLPLDELSSGGLEALGALDDEVATPAATEVLPAIDDDDEAFSVSEYLALAHLEQESAKSTDTDTVPLTAGDLSPAAQQAALLSGIQQASELLPKDNAQESAADYAKRMAQQMSSGDAPTLDMPASDGGAESAADYAKRMAQQYGSDPSSVSQPVMPAQPALSPAQEALAEKFRQTAKGVADLRQSYQSGLISQADVQARQRDYQIYDDNTGDWWMMGIESGVWYRYDRGVSDWVESQPPVPLNRPSVPTATGIYNPDEVLSGSLPYFPDNNNPQEFSGQPTVVYGDISSGNTPIPNPNQPQFDPNLTMVGDVANMNTLPSSADTLQGIRMVDSQQTMPMQTVGDMMNQPISSPMQMESAPDYNQSVGVPTFDNLQNQRQNELLRYAIVGGLVLFGIAVVAIIAVLGFAYVWYNNTVEPYREQIAGLANYRPSFQTARIMDAQGNLIVELNSQAGGARTQIPLEEMSPYVLHAVISTENQTFYDDSGFDIFRIVGAFFENLSAGEITSGASTITQQIARNLILGDSSVTAERKLTEIAVAMAIADAYGKNEILELYMNENFFGNQSYGVEAASEFYFNHPASDLNMAESAMLVGIISSPALYDPVVNRESAFSQARVVIRRMLEMNCVQFQHGEWAETNQPFCINETTRVNIGDSQGAQLVRINNNGTYGGVLSVQLAQMEINEYLPRSVRFQYPHFVNYVQAQVEAIYGSNAMFQRGFTIYTTLNPRIQDDAEAALQAQVAALVNNGVNTGAVMVTDPTTGAILAMVGSPDFSDERIDGQVDNTRTWQQPGSAIKPVIYTSAIEGVNAGNYLTPASILWDVPSSYPIAGAQPYQPVNFDGTFNGPVPVRYALQNSLNVATIKAYEFIGQDRFINTANRMGIQFLPEAVFGLPSALGANEVRLIDMMKMYGTIANNGQFIPLYSIQRITEDAGGVEIDVALPERSAPTTAITPQVAYVMQNILSDDATRAPEFGANGPLTLVNLGIPTLNNVGAKTGTTNDGRDLWAMGFTSNTVVGVWLGTYDNSPTVGVTGSNAPALVWNRVMSTALAGRTPRSFVNPGGVLQDTVCRDTGTLASPECPNRVTEIYIQNQPPPPATSGFVQTLNVDSWSGYLANEWCQENVVQRTVANIPDAFAVNWIVNTPAGRNWAQRVGLPSNLETAPAQSCAQGQILPTVIMNNPTNGQNVTTTLTITGQISASDLQRYDLEYANAANPTTFTRISTNTQQFPTGGSTLGTWDTTTVPNGTYTLRLAAYSSTGGFIYRTAQVNIQNILPTATPPPLPTNTPNLPTPINIGSTAIPFDSLNPTPTATLAP